MANIINGTDTGSGGLITTGDSSDELQLQTAETARVTLTNTAVVVNEGGNDVDFRVEGDTNANLLFVDASADAVGIGTSSPSDPLTVQANTSASAVRIIGRSAGNSSRIDFYNNANSSRQMSIVSEGSASTILSESTIPLAFATNSAERMRIDSSGNVGIGTSTPARQFTVFSNTAQTDISIVSSTTGLAILQMGDTAADNQGQIVYRNSDDAMTFGVNGSERARIDSSGNLLVGTTSKLSGGLSGIDINAPANAGITLGWGGSSEAFFYLASATVNRWETPSGTSIEVSSGNSNGVSLANGATSWGSLSDERKKDIIEPIKNAAEKVSSLRAVIGKYKTDDEGIRRSLLIAQDVQAVLPEAVVENEDGDLILQYTETIPLLVAAIKELKAELDTVKAELATLKG